MNEKEMTEALTEIERRKEEIQEEFFEVAFQRKHEAIEEAKAECKKNKIPKEQEKKRIQEAQQIMDQKRKEGSNEINKIVQAIIADDSITMQEKIARLQDTETIRALMNQFFNKPQEDESSQ